MHWLSVFEIGFLMGLLGSVHCIGMCGPLVMALPISHLSNVKKVASVFLYHVGKIASYGMLGVLLGLIGSQFSIALVQSNLSIVIGTFMIVYVIYVFVVKPKSRFIQLYFLYNPISKQLGKLFKSRFSFAFLFIGFLNGLLPCGMVYLALSSAMATQNIVQGGLFMIFFGLGTWPALVLVVFGGQFMSLVFRKKVQSLLPVFIFGMGLMLVLRGMNLGIPYISPHTTIGSDIISCHN